MELRKYIWAEHFQAKFAMKKLKYFVKNKLVIPLSIINVSNYFNSIYKIWLRGRIYMVFENLKCIVSEIEVVSAPSHQNLRLLQNKSNWQFFVKASPKIRQLDELSWFLKDSKLFKDVKVYQEIRDKCWQHARSVRRTFQKRCSSLCQRVCQRCTFAR